MDELLKNLASQTGLDPSTAKNALGAVIAFLKDHLPAGLFGQVEESVPDAQGAIDSFEANKAGGGFLSAAAGVVGKLVGGGAGEASKLVSMLTSAGLNVTQIQSFLPKVIEQLQAFLPADLIEKIKGLVLSGAPADATAPAGE